MIESKYQNILIISWDREIYRLMFTNISFFYFYFLFFCTIDIFNDRVSYKIFGDDITGFRSTISVDRLERAKRECHGVFSEKSFNVTGNHSPLRHNKYCQCKRFIWELSLMFSPCCSAHIFPSQSCVTYDNIFSINTSYTYIYILYSDKNWKYSSWMCNIGKYMKT